MGEFVTGVLFQIGMTVGVLMLFGWLIALCNRAFYANFGSSAIKVCYVTGFIGTPLHELSHALFCLIFRHKIVEIKLFQVGSEDGTLGYVAHTYNRKNLYHLIGCFFIGVAPIIVISTLLFLFARLLMPGMMEGIRMLSGSVTTLDFGMMAKGLGRMLLSLVRELTNPWAWLFLLFACFVGLHMNLSGADIKHALKGLVVLLIVWVLLDVLLVIVDVGLFRSFTAFMVRIGGYLMCTLILSLLISMVMVLVSFIIRKLRRKKTS